MNQPLRMVGDDGPAKALAFSNPDGSLAWAELAEARRTRSELLVAALKAPCRGCGQARRRDPDSRTEDPCEDPRALALARGKRILRLNLVLGAPCPGCGLPGEVPL